jgi:hypothetical protein
MSSSTALARPAIRFPRLQSYVDGLPRGLDSYPEHRTKSALARSFLGAGLAEVCDDVPRELAELVKRPPPVSVWIRQVHAHALVALARDVLFDDDGAFARYCYEEQRQLFAGKLYELLLRCTSPERLLASAQKRWATFNQGCEIAAIVGQRSATISVSHPVGMFDDAALTAMTEAIRATLDLSRARHATVVVHTRAPLRTDCIARW